MAEKFGCLVRRSTAFVAGLLTAISTVAAMAQQGPSLTYRRGETIAVIQVGTNQNDLPVLRRIEYGVVSPTVAEGNDDPLMLCISKAGLLGQARPGWKVKSVGEALREGMTQIVARTVMPKIHADMDALEQNEDYAKAFSNARASLELHLSATAVSELSDLLGLQSHRLAEELEKAGCANTKGKVYLALTQRVCAGAADCVTFRGRQSPSLTYLRGNAYADRFDLLIRWAYAYRAEEAAKDKADYAKGLMSPNQYVLVSDQGAAPPVDGTQIQDAYRGESKPATDQEVQQYMERLVASVRAARSADADTLPKISAQVLRVLNVSKQVYVRVADAFVYTEGVAQTLPSKPDATLVSISDRMAEARLAECVLNKRVAVLDGNGQPNLGALKTCTGYSFKDLKAVAACLPNARQAEVGLCSPKLEAVLDGTVLKETIGLMQLGTYVRNAKSLAAASLVGRLPNLKYSDLANTYAKACATAEGESATADCLFKQHFKGRDQEDLEKIRGCARQKGAMVAECLAKTGFGREEARVKAAAGCASGKNDALADCVAAGLMDNETQRKVTCIKENNDATTRALCIAKGLPGVEDRIKACINGAADTQLSCLGALPGMPARVTQVVAECKSTDSLKAGAACARALGVNVPAGVDTAIVCMAKSSTAEALACAADGRIGGDAGKVLSCATQSNFDAAGTGACAIGTLLKFNEDLMMAATCAATTGGEPTSTATCTFGKLAMREFDFCKDAKFGEGRCFGKNNTLVKLFNIGPNSVAAGVINIQLDIVKGTVAFVENPGKATGDFVRNAGRELTIVRDNVVREAEAFHENVRREASKVFGKGIHIKVSCCSIKL